MGLCLYEHDEHQTPLTDQITRLD